MVPIFHLETWDVDTFPFTQHLSSAEQHEQALCSSPEAKWCSLTHVHMPKLSLPEKKTKNNKCNINTEWPHPNCLLGTALGWCYIPNYVWVLSGGVLASPLQIHVSNVSVSWLLSTIGGYSPSHPAVRVSGAQPLKLPGRARLGDRDTSCYSKHWVILHPTFLHNFNANRDSILLC